MVSVIARGGKRWRDRPFATEKSNTRLAALPGTKNTSIDLVVLHAAALGLRDPPLAPPQTQVSRCVGMLRHVDRHRVGGGAYSSSILGCLAESPE
eukprot:3494262-Rhodomonas_salina.8